MAGTLAFDLLKYYRQMTAVSIVFMLSVILMLSGFGLSCLSTLYDLKDVSKEQSMKFIASPVVPDFSVAAGRTWYNILAEPPFFPPPTPEKRVPNYWAMDKRVVTQSFVMFGTGFALALYGTFIIACDVLGFGLRVFDMFGKNPLASYIVHHFVTLSILLIVPKDSPIAWCLFGLAVSFGITYLFVRFLESRKLYLRL